jgi:hypothetical protein
VNHVPGGKTAHIIDNKPSALNHRAIKKKIEITLPNPAYEPLQKNLGAQLPIPGIGLFPLSITPLLLIHTGPSPNAGDEHPVSG